MSFKLLNMSLEWDEIEYDLFGQFITAVTKS